MGWRGLVAVLVASRLVVAAAALLAENVVTRNPLLTAGADGPVISSLTSWDGWWYLGIVQDGYHAATRSRARTTTSPSCRCTRCS